MDSKNASPSMPAQNGEDNDIISRPAQNGSSLHATFDLESRSRPLLRRVTSTRGDSRFASTLSPDESLSRPFFGDHWTTDPATVPQRLGFDQPKQIPAFNETDRRNSAGLSTKNLPGSLYTSQTGRASPSDNLFSGMFVRSDPAAVACHASPEESSQLDLQSGQDTSNLDSPLSICSTPYPILQSPNDMNLQRSPLARQQTNLPFGISNALLSTPLTPFPSLESSYNRHSQASPIATSQIDLQSSFDSAISDSLFSTTRTSPDSMPHIIEDRPSTSRNLFDSSGGLPSPQVDPNLFEDSVANTPIRAEGSTDSLSWTCIQPSRRITNGLGSTNLCEDGNKFTVRCQQYPAVGSQGDTAPLGQLFPTNGNQVNHELGLLSGNTNSYCRVPVWNKTSKAFSEQSGSSLVTQQRKGEPSTSLGEAEIKRHPDHPNDSLASSEDFVAAGGGEGIFKVRKRGVHKGRPLSLVLRPRPFKETQAYQKRVLACTNSTVWAVHRHNGIMVWDIESACGATRDGRDNITGDEDAAAFSVLPVHGSIVTCLVPDVSNNILWSGDNGGKVTAWSIHVSHGNRRTQDMNTPLLTWHAHQTPVLSMTVTSYGELWTGSENGSIRVWPWEVIVMALSSVADQSHTAGPYMERSYLDLRSHGAAAGASMLSNTDVKYLLAEHSNCRVWSGGSYLLALWNARTRDILKVFGSSAQPEFSSPHISPVPENIWGDEARANLAKVSKKEKTQRGLSFFQCSKNVVMGAADAVRRAAFSGQSDNKKVEALVVATDGTVWAGYANGLIICRDSHGNRLREKQYISIAVRSMCAFGAQIWIGYADGTVHVLNLETGNLLGSWHAHQSPVAQMQVGGNHVFTMADHGGIRGWNLLSPSPLDEILRSEMCSKELNYTRHRKLKILAGTWNVSKERASFESLKIWLGSHAAEASIVAVGLQEMEMGAGALALAAAKETVGLEGSCNGQWWLESIGKALDETKVFVRLASRQLAGLLIGAWIKMEFMPYVGEVGVGAVACGLGHALGNKGAVAVKMIVFRRTICVMNCHFAAHMDGVARRNADFDYVYRRMAFVGVASTSMAGGVSSTKQKICGNTNRQTLSTWDSLDSYIGDSPHGLMDGAVENENLVPELAKSDMLIWIGDFNYRIGDLSYEDAISLISYKLWDVLLNKDQLRMEMREGRVFQGMREGNISFPPTYKFDKGYTGFDASSEGYDSSEKKRVPAWCDRILFRDTFDKSDKLQEVSLLNPTLASICRYEACMDVADSDHKPVYCMFDVDFAVIDQAARRLEYGNLMLTNTNVREHLTQSDVVPETVINTNCVHLEDYNVSALKITNECGQNRALFDIHCDGEAVGRLCPCKNNHTDSRKSLSLRGCYGFPLWLQVVPASGILGPCQTMEIILQYTGGEKLGDNDLSIGEQNWSNAKIDKLAVLTVNVKGSLSICNRQHKVWVFLSASSQIGHQNRDPVDHNQRKFLNRSDVLASDLTLSDAPDLLCCD